MSTVHTFTLLHMHVRDVESVVRDLSSNSYLLARFRDIDLASGLTWARSANAYLVPLHPGEVMCAGQHYMLCNAGTISWAQTVSSVSDKLVLNTEDPANFVKPMFIAALKVYGRSGRGQDGHFNTQPGHNDSIFNMFEPVFVEGRAG